MLTSAVSSKQRDEKGTNPSFSIEASIGGSVFAMFHVTYLICFLTVLATILLARKSWIGLLIAIVNSLVFCAIGLRTSQLLLYSSKPVVLLRIRVVYALNMSSLLERQNT